MLSIVNYDTIVQLWHILQLYKNSLTMDGHDIKILIAWFNYVMIVQLCHDSSIIYMYFNYIEIVELWMCSIL